MDIRILLADDHNLIRDGIRLIIEAEPGMRVVGEAEDGLSAARLARELHPDLVILDIMMPELSGIETTRRILDENAEVKVLILSGFREKRYVVDALQAGASGYLLKDCVRSELLAAIRAILAGEEYLSRQVLKLVVDELRRRNSGDGGLLDGLTSREVESLRLIGEGKSTKQIAERLNVSVKTAETYRQQLMKKLEVDNVAALVKFAIREGLAGTDD